MEAKLIRHIPSGKSLPYWDRYEYECIDCGEHFFRGTHTSRTNPYCGKCAREHDKIKVRERNKIKRQMIYEQGKAIARAEIHSELIDEIAQLGGTNMSRDNLFCFACRIKEIAERLEVRK